MVPIHPTAIVAPQVCLGADVEIGPYSVLHGNVVIGDRAKIGAYCELGIATPLSNGTPLEIGNDALIRSHSIFYEGSQFGPGLTTGHRVTVREHTSAGSSFQIGTLSEIQGDCRIGDHVRFQSNVFVSKNTVIGNFVWILPYAVLTNDPTPPSDYLIGCTVEDYATICAMSIVLPGVVVGRHSLVAAHSCVSKNVPEGMTVAGSPARIIGPTKLIKLRDGSNMAAYPWTRHFHRGYPDEIIETWKRKASESNPPAD